MQICRTSFLTVALCLAGCAQISEQDKGASMDMQTTLAGEAYYLERKLLPPGALLTVSLEDVSRTDVASTVIATTERPLDGAPPYPFELSWEPGALDAGSRHSLRASISASDRLLMTSTQALDPFAAADDPLRIRLVSIGRSNSEPSDAFGADTGLAIVSVNPLATLTNSYWKLVSLGGTPVVMAEGQQREAFFQLRDEGSAVKGFAGCNQLTGTFTTSGNDLTLGPLALPRRACISGMETESAFVAALEATRYFSIHEHAMTLLNAVKEPIAAFEAQYFN